MLETNSDLITSRNLQWHPAFYAGIQIEFADEAHKLIFENEHHLGTKPKQIDVLVIKKDTDTPIEKNIGRIFLKHNLIEYKSPNDSLNIDDFYLVYAYACLYKSDTNHVDTIAATDITITFVCTHYPRKFFNHLKNVRNYDIEFIEEGIYYVKGDFIPIQILVTQDLTNEQNLWLHNLNNNIQDTNIIGTLLNEYEKHQDEKNYKSIMNIITNANGKKFKEVSKMCEALERIYWEVHGERIMREQKEALDKAVAEAVAEAVAKAVAEAVAKKQQTIDEQEAIIKQLEARLATVGA